jgi:hypothetical protein
MTIPKNSVPMLFAVLATAGLLTGCGTATDNPAGTPTAAVRSATVAPEHNPVGDIPDTQVYVPYSPPSQLFTVSVPEGWAKINDGPATEFTDKLNAVRIEINPFLDTLTPDVVRREELPQIQSASSGYHFGAVSVVQRKAGPVILATYQVASTPNEVTGKTGVDAVERYSYWRDGHEVILTLSGPVGADNVDPWRTITDSLRWQ